MNARLDALLRDAPAFEHALNLYAHDESGDIRFDNLRIYLRRMQALSPRCLIIGEAPGYQGTLNTGVPFTSEFLLLRDNCRHNVHGQQHGYRLLHQETKRKKEPSATIVWRVLDELPEAPMIWSAFPMHPHKPGISSSNRAPNTEELAYGREVLSAVLNEFPNIEKVIAVGNVSEKILQQMGHSPIKVRHPSHGGANKFEEGLKVVYRLINYPKQ